MKNLVRVLSIATVLSTSALADGSGPSNRQAAQKLAKGVFNSGFSLPYEMEDRGNIIDIFGKKEEELVDIIILNLRQENGEICTSNFYYHNSDAVPLVDYNVCIDSKTNQAYSPKHMGMVAYRISRHIFDERAQLSSSLNSNSIFDPETKSGYIFNEISNKVDAGMRLDENGNGICTDVNYYSWTDEHTTYCELHQFEGIVKLKN